MLYTDSHCHLDLISKGDDKLIGEIIQRAHDVGVKYLQTISTNRNNIELVKQIAKKYKNVFASVGIHPSEVAKDSDNQMLDPDQICELAKDDKVIAIGETGLDYFYNKEESYDAQKKSFVNHIIASQKLGFPTIIHTRAADEDTANIVCEQMRIKEFPALIHCFTASKEFAEKMLNQGLYISISGIVTFKNATDLQDIVRYIPLDKMLIETDAPYLTPVPNRGKPNEPAYVKHVAEYIAKLKNISEEKVAEITTRNFLDLFKPNIIA